VTELRQVYLRPHWRPTGAPIDGAARVTRLRENLSNLLGQQRDEMWNGLQLQERFMSESDRRSQTVQHRIADWGVGGIRVTVSATKPRGIASWMMPEGTVVFDWDVAICR
jgi:hypothetical protein